MAVVFEIAPVVFVVDVTVHLAIDFSYEIFFSAPDFSGAWKNTLSDNLVFDEVVDFVVYFFKRYLVSFAV